MSTTEIKHPPVPPPPGAVLLTIPEAAHELRCSVATVYREIASGKLITRKVRGKTLIHREDVAAYLDAARREAAVPDVLSPAPPSRQRISLKAAGLIEDDDFGYRARGPKKAKG